MTTYIMRRLLQALVVLIIVTLLVFFVMRLLPGDPLIIYLAQSADIEAMPPEMLTQLRQQYGLDKPLMVQYFNWVTGVFQGNFGESIFYHSRVGSLMLERFPVTVHLGVLAVLTGAIFGVLG